MTDKNVKLIMFSIIVSFALHTQASGADLVDIRTGFHTSFSRLVLQFDSEVRYNVFKDLSNRKVMIEANPVKNIGFNDSAKFQYDKHFLRYINYEHSGHHLKVTAYLATSEVRVVTFSLNNPFRIVIDIYQMHQNIIETAKDDHKTLEPLDKQKDALANLESEPKEEAVTAQRSPQEFNVDILSNQFRDSDDFNEASNDLSYSSHRSPTPQVNGTLENHEQSNKVAIFLLVATAFILIDSLLLTFYVINRNKRRKILKMHENAAPGIHTLANSQEQEFGDILKSSINKGLITPKPIPDIVQALEKLEFSSVIPKEMWIVGRDGIKFLKNIKKAYLN